MDEHSMTYMFSIIIPAYNVEKYLESCVNSVIQQTYNNYQIIIVDDGSTDNTGDIAEKLKENSNRISVIHQKNLGLSEARNTGIRKAVGSYIVLLDGDDLLSKGALDNLYKCILSTGYPDFVISRRESFIDGSSKCFSCKYFFGDKLKTLQRYELYKKLQDMEDCWLGAWIFTLKRTSLIDNNLFFYPGILHEDEEWVPRVIFSLQTIGFNNELLYRNRTSRSGSITATLNIKRLFDKLKIIDLLDQYFNESDWNRNIIESINDRKAKLCFGVISDLYFYKNDNRYSELKNALRNKANVLLTANDIKYKTVYFIYKVIGPQRLSYLLNKMQDKF